MGGGKDQKTANTQLEEQHKYQAEQQKQFDTRNTGDLNASRGRGDELYGSLKAGYEGLAGGAGAAVPPGGGGGGGGMGYIAPTKVALDPRFKDVESQYKNFMSTGGWDPKSREGQEGRIGLLTEMGKTGGISPEDQARARGGGVYDEFAKTGGFSDKDVANIRTRGVSGIPAMYGRVRDEANRGAAISGGYGPGRQVLAGRMARQQAGAAADASLNTELGIKGEVNKGRQWGAGGMSGSELALQGQLNSNRLAGLQGGNAAQQAMMESVIGGQEWGTTGQHGLVGEQQARADREAAAEDEARRAAAASAASAASAGDANSRWAQEFNARQKMAGLEGLGSLYSGPGAGEYNVNKDFALQSAQGYGGEVRDTAVAQKTGNKSAWDTGAQYLSAGAGIMGGVMTGGASTALNAGMSTLGNVGRVEQPRYR